jgi:hypothetical protein
VELNHTLKGGDYDVSQLIGGDATSFLAEKGTGLGINATRRREVVTLPDNKNDPGQTGRTVLTTDTYRKPHLPLRDLRKQTTTEGRVKEMLLNVFSYKKEIDYAVTRHKTQAYTPNSGDEKDDSIDARAFTAYRSNYERAERGVSVRVGGSIPTPIGSVTVPLNLRLSADKNDHELKSFTYGNDVGAMAIIMTKLFVDNDINMPVLEADIAESTISGEPLVLLDCMDPRLSDAFLGDQQYDHMSAILSKFRNSAFVIEKADDGKVVMRAPKIDADGMVIIKTISSQLEGTLHNSKGQEMYRQDDNLENNAAPKTYLDRSGFFGYLVNRYDDSLIQDGYLHWKKTYQVPFPKIVNIDELLSDPIDRASPPSPTNPTRQQWLKAASKQERKDFYQNDPDGKAMLLDYLKVLSLAGALNDTVFQTNTYQIMHDKEQVERLNGYFTPDLSHKRIDPVAAVSPRLDEWDTYLTPRDPYGFNAN